jgi:SRSO17 transposase
LIPGPNSTCCWSAARSPSPELAYYICHCSGPVPVAELVRVAGSRSRVEETFQFAKNEPGLDHHPVRRYPAWYRHITLSMLAAAFLAVTAHTERGDQKGVHRPPAPAVTSWFRCPAAKSDASGPS